MEPPRLAALSFTRTFGNVSWSAMLQPCSDAEDEHPNCFPLKNVGDGAPRDRMAHVGPRSLHSSPASIAVLGGHPVAHEGHPPSARYQCPLSRGALKTCESQKNRPPTADTRSDFCGFFLPSQHPTTSIGQPGTFFHVTIFLWGWPGVTIPLVALSDRWFVEAAPNLRSQGSLWKPDPRPPPDWSLGISSEIHSTVT